MKISRIVAGAALAASLATGAAQAGTLNGTGAAAIVGISSSTTSIGLGSSFTNTLFSVIGGGTRDLVPTVGAIFTTNPVTATVGTAVSFAASFGSFSGSISTASAAGTTNNRTVDLYALGTFTPAGSLASYSAGPMSLTFSFTQTGGPSAAVSGSFSIASPPASPPGVPEPMSLALFGMGLAGLGIAARRKA